MEKYVRIYFRKKDGIYVIPLGVTEAGWIDIEPFYYLPLDSKPENVWISIEKALESANREVAHPKVWGRETAWYQKAGVKTWREFAGKAKTIIGVTETEGHYVFTLHYYDRGKVFSDSETAVKLPKNSERGVIVSSLKKLFCQK